MTDLPVTISVHLRLDAPGHVVRLTRGSLVQKFPVTTLAEAKSLARSILEYVQGGSPVDVFVRSVSAGGGPC